MELKIDEDMCIGCGSCTGVCPEYFDMKGPIAVVTKQPEEITDEIEDAIDTCPTEAISYE